MFIITAVQSRSLTDVVWDSRLGEQMVLWGPLVTGAGYLRPLTAGFLHLDATHLFLNMFLLVFVGASVERFVGSGPFAVAYLAGTLGSSAAVLWQNFTIPTAGASGALYAVMALLVAVASRRSVDLRAPLVLIAVNIAYTFLASNVSFWGHAGGLVWGAAMAWPLTSPSTRSRWIAAWLGLAGAVGAVVLSASP